MGIQSSLFTNVNSEVVGLEPSGFRYKDDFISEEQEASLSRVLERLDLKPFEFQGYLGNRRVMNFGLKYDFTQRTVETADEIPDFLNDLLGRAASFASYERDDIRQVGINEYRAGAGIGWHKDKPEFGIIIGVSLCASATMRFRTAQGKGWRRISHIVRPRSIYVLAAEARTEWEHSIPALDALRYSITMRTLAPAKGVGLRSG